MAKPLRLPVKRALLAWLIIIVFLWFGKYMLQRREAQIRAAAYFEEQKPLFEKAARGWVLNDYFELDVTEPGMTWEQLIGIRLKKMAQMYRANKRDDFKVEKDKCEMYRFLKLNKFNFPLILGEWDSKQGFAADFMTLIDNSTTWPLFLKCCHLTQGSSKSVLLLKNAAHARAQQAMITEWVREKWDFRADDHTRPWREDGNLLTDTLIPGLLLQGPAVTKYNPEVRESHVFELKVEVFWGRAYLATCPDTRIYDRSSFFTRQRGGQIEYFADWFSNVFNAPQVLPRSSWYYWMVRDGHLQCAWSLAESVARTIGADTMRVDVFINPDDAKGCSVNEDSLSSGMGYGPHFPYISQLWSEPHRLKWYSTFKSEKPAYEMTAKPL